MEGAFVWFAVGIEDYVLAFGDACVYISQGHRIQLFVVLVVGQVYAGNLQWREVGVEQFYPCSASSVVVDDAVVVLDHHFVDAQCASSLPESRERGCRRQH